MGFEALRTLTFAINANVHGMPATVTRPHPDHAPIATLAIWVTPTTPDVPPSLDLHRAEPQKAIALSRADVPTVPRGTRIAMAERHDPNTVKTWRVDDVQEQAEDHTRAIVLLEAS